MFENWLKQWFNGHLNYEEKENFFAYSLSWKNIRTISCVNENNENVRIDLRLAFNDVTKENLVDFIDYNCLLRNHCKQVDKYYIVYFGLFSDEIKTHSVNNYFIIDKKCKTVEQKYINIDSEVGLKDFIKCNFSNDFLNLKPITLSDSSKENLVNEKKFGLRTKGVEKKDLPNKPLISIVIPTFNSEAIIEQAIQSALVQTYDNKEIIIVDGGSKDNTAGVVKKYENYIDLFNSEPDKNIFDAINKGTYLSTGKYSVFIGSDDLLTYNALETIVESYNNYGEKDFYYGNGMTLTASGFIRKDICFLKGKNFSEFRIYHPAMYIKKDVFVELNGFNIDFFISADADFELKLITQKKSYSKTENFLCIYRGGGHSSRFMWKKIKQVNKIFRQYHSLDFPYYLITVRLIFFMWVRSIFGVGFITRMSALKYKFFKKGK